MAATNNTASLLQEAEAIRDRLVAWRQTFYLQPELSGEEIATAARIADELQRLGLEVTTGVGGHGVVGILRGSLPGPTLAYRADMDALPIQDTLAPPRRALPLGIKHACGHDVHMAIALGVAHILSAHQTCMRGQVKFIFQPAEESLDGARAMIADDVLSTPRPQALIALHAFPLNVRTVGIHRDDCLAGMEEFRVRFYAPGGNLEHLIEAACRSLQDLSTGTVPADTQHLDAVVKQMIAGCSMQETILVSCWPQSDDASAAHHLLGLISMADFEARPEVHGKVRRVLDEVAETSGASYDLTYPFSNPPLRNDPHLVNNLLSPLRTTLGSRHVLEFRAPYPFAHEDLALYAGQVPSALIWLGTANPTQGIASLLHTPDYDVDEAALVIGTQVAGAALWHLLSVSEADI